MASLMVPAGHVQRIRVLINWHATQIGFDPTEDTESHFTDPLGWKTISYSAIPQGTLIDANNHVAKVCGCCRQNKGYAFIKQPGLSLRR